MKDISGFGGVSQLRVMLGKYLGYEGFKIKASFFCADKKKSVSLLHVKLVDFIHFLQNTMDSALA